MSFAWKSSESHQDRLNNILVAQLGADAATKAAITSLSEGIRIDVMHTPIKVSCVHPGFIRSEINEKRNTTSAKNSN